jgi:hypothetical protein
VAGVHHAVLTEEAVSHGAPLELWPLEARRAVTEAKPQGGGDVDDDDTISAVG